MIFCEESVIGYIYLSGWFHHPGTVVSVDSNRQVRMRLDYSLAIAVVLSLAKEKVPSVDKQSELLEILVAGA